MLDGYSDLELIDAYTKAGARKSFLDFAFCMEPSEQPAPHHRVMARMLEACEQGKVRRLMLFLPPRAAKSLYGKYFIAWMLGRRPDTKIVHTTHTGPLADDVGYEIRRMINSDRYPWSEISVQADRAARRDWQTTAGGRYYGTSMSGGPTGRPANILMIDDPITNAQDADSDLIRDRQWQEYIRGYRSRLQPWADGKPPIEIMIMTRWHEDDLPGRHLPKNFDGRPGKYVSRIDGLSWIVCSMPARAEHENDLLGREKGAWLWPERFGDDSQYATAEKIGGRAWSALYQQRPAPESGVLIRREWLQFYDAPPDLKRLRIYGTSDYAVTAAGKDTNDPDYTVHMIFGVDPDWNVWVLDMWRGRTSSDEWIEALLDLAKEWKPLLWGEERGQILSSVGPLIKRRMVDRRVFFARQGYTSKDAKGVRAGEYSAQNAQGLIGWMAQGKWRLPATLEALPAKSWWRRAGTEFASIDDLIREMMQFPAGKHDDMVDPQTLFARMIGQIIAGQSPRKDETVPPNSLEALFREHEAGL